jgi:hypothetical protein
MKQFSRLMMSACLAVFSALPVAAQVPPIRIMPLGGFHHGWFVL